MATKLKPGMRVLIHEDLDDALDLRYPWITGKVVTVEQVRDEDVYIDWRGTFDDEFWDLPDYLDITDLTIV